MPTSKRWHLSWRAPSTSFLSQRGSQNSLCVGNEKGWSVFLPSEYQARRPKVPFCSRRVARTVGEHFCTRFMLEVYLTLRSAMRKVTACFYPQNIRRAARKFLSAQGASPQQCGWTLLYAFYAWNLSDASIGNEKGYSVFLPSEYQARRPKVPFRSRRVAPTVGEHFCTRFMLEIYPTLRSAMRKVTACFYPQNIRRAARKFLSAQGASPEQWVNTSVRFILEIYLTVRSAMRKVTARFYPQNIRRAARKFLSAQGASPEQWVNTPVRFILEIYLTPNNSIDVITIATIFQIIRIGGRSVMQTTRIFS